MTLNAQAQRVLSSNQESAEIVAQAKEQNIPTLIVGQPLERELAGGETHRYQLTLSAGQYLFLVVEQKGIDVVVTLAESSGEKISVVNLTAGGSGSEAVKAEVVTSGSYLLLIQPAKSEAAQGRYRVQIKELRKATTEDHQRLTAEHLMAEGGRLLNEGSSASRHLALEKYQAALPLWQALGNRAIEANTLNQIGLAQILLGEKQQALASYQQALGLYRILGNRGGEADSLGRVGAAYRSLGEKPKALDSLQEALSLWEGLGVKTAAANTLLNIGIIYNEMREYQKELVAYQQALVLYQAMKDRNSEADMLNFIGGAYLVLSEKQKALAVYQQALLLYRATGNRGREADTLNYIGFAYFQLGEQKKAQEVNQQALALYRELGNQRGEAEIRRRLGGADDSSNEQRMAAYQQSLLRYRAANDRKGEANSLRGIGTIYSLMGERQKAVDAYQQALRLYQELGDQRSEASLQLNLGRLFNDLSQWEKGIEASRQAALLYQTLGEKSGEESALLHIGNIYRYSLGDWRKAIDYDHKVLLLQRAKGESGWLMLKFIADSYRALGEQGIALDYYQQLLASFKTSSRGGNDDIGTLNVMADIYQTMGEQQKALEFRQEVLKRRLSAADNHNDNPSLLSQIGREYLQLGQKQKALDSFQRVLLLSRSADKRIYHSQALLNIGGIYQGMGEKQKALEAYQQMLALHRNAGELSIESQLLKVLGKRYEDEKDLPKAEEFYTLALPLSRKLGARELEADVLRGLAFAQFTQNNLGAARANIEAAINLVESIRIELTSLDMRASLLAKKSEFYALYLELLMRQHQLDATAGHDKTAFQTSERLRARTLLELLREANADIRQGVDEALLKQERSLRHQLNSKANKKIELLNGKGDEANAAALTKDISALTTELEQVEARIRSTSPRYAALTQPQPLGLKEVQPLLDPDQLLLEYVLGEERSYLFAVTPTGMTTYELPKRAELEKAALYVYDLLHPCKFEDLPEFNARAMPEYPGAVASLSQLLLGQVAEQLGQKRLLIVADGALQYLPFAVLPIPKGSTPEDRKSAAATLLALTARPRPCKLEADSRRPPQRTATSSEPAVVFTPLLVEHEIVYLPSASTLAVLRRELVGRMVAPKAIAILADPVFDKTDARVKARLNTAKPATLAARKEALSEFSSSARAVRASGASDSRGGINRLPFTRREAQAILALVPNASTKVALDFEANQDTANHPDLSQYRYVHFATHGFVNTTHAELSGVLLSLVNAGGQEVNGFLGLSDVYNLQLPAELVTLSACQTALGKEVKGEGLIGLTRGFMYAGAARVAVSLWAVSDEATAELMARFYRGILQDGLRPAAALRAAQLSLMKEPRWQAPYYWAAFMLQGEPR